MERDLLWGEGRLASLSAGAEEFEEVLKEVSVVACLSSSALKGVGGLVSCVCEMSSTLFLCELVLN